MGGRDKDLILLYEPRPLQVYLHKNLKRFNVLVAHRRFGKSVFCINELLSKAAANRRENPRYAYIAPLLSQAKDVAWEYLKQYAERVPRGVANESELRVDLPDGARIRLYGADNPDRLRGLYLDGVVFDEYAQMQPRVWPEVIRPALADREGWAIFIGTPMGRNQFCKLYEEARADPSWFTALFRASETGIIPPQELAAAAAVMSEDQYAQEFECSFDTAVVGAYY
jgi:phage terminase large subunit